LFISFTDYLLQSRHGFLRAGLIHLFVLVADIVFNDIQGQSKRVLKVLLRRVLSAELFDELSGFAFQGLGFFKQPFFLRTLLERGIAVWSSFFPVKFLRLKGKWFRW